MIPRPWIIAPAFLFALGLVGRMDYEDQLRIEAEKREAYMAHEIYREGCAKRGKEYIAGQADGGKVRARCVKANLKEKA